MDMRDGNGGMIYRNENEGKDGNCIVPSQYQ